ncbi:MAG: DUF4199 domain-containing protein [Vicinamibacterales bacterium]
MRKIVVTFGLIAGAIMSVLMALSLQFQDAIGFEHSYLVGYTSLVLGFLMVFFGVKSYRDNVQNGSVTFGRAFKVGLMITGIATLCYVGTWEVMYYGFMPDFLDKYSAYAMEQAKKSGATEAQMAEQQKKMADFVEQYKNPLVNVAFTALEPLPVGLVFTLVAAGVLSRKRVS